MSYAAKSIVGFGVYALIAGVALLFLPNQTLQLLGFEKTTEHWIIMVALLMMGFGLYYVVLGVTDTKQFFIVSIVGRVMFFVFCVVLLFLGKVPTSILLFGIIDLLSAIWTAMAMRIDKRAQLLATR